VKDKKFLTEGGDAAGSRWEKDALFSDLYHGLYNKKTLVDSLAAWEHIAKDAGISKVSGLSIENLVLIWLTWDYRRL